MADHVSRKFSGSLFQNIGQCNRIKMVDAFGRVLALANLQCNRSLSVLAVKIEMSEHFSAVSGV